MSEYDDLMRELKCYVNRIAEAGDDGAFEAFEAAAGYYRAVKGSLRHLIATDWKGYVEGLRCRFEYQKRVYEAFVKGEKLPEPEGIDALLEEEWEE